MKKFKFLIVFLVFSLAGCASYMRDTYQRYDQDITIRTPHNSRVVVYDRKDRVVSEFRRVSDNTVVVYNGDNTVTYRANNHATVRIGESVRQRGVKSGVAVYGSNNKTVNKADVTTTIRLDRVERNRNEKWWHFWHWHPKKASYRVEVSKDGYESQEIEISPKFNWKHGFWGNMLLGAVVLGPYFMLWDTEIGGAWTLNPSPIDVNLKPKTRPRQSAFTSKLLSESTLAILPITGGNVGERDVGERERMTNMFSTLPKVRQTFGRAFITSSVAAITGDAQFKSSTGLTDSAKIAQLGKQRQADFVAAGHIYTADNSKILLLTIIHVESQQIIAGSYNEIKRLEDARIAMEQLINNAVNTVTKHNKRQRSRLAVLPFIPVIPGSDKEQSEAEVLSHILTIKFANDGRYAVLPLNNKIEKARIKNRRLDHPINMKRIGDELWLQYVVAGNITQMEEEKRTNIQRFNAQSSVRVNTRSWNYNEIIDVITGRVRTLP